jgi:predicted nucleic acid-binding protein
MGVLEKVVGGSVYLDANVFIYAIEDYPDYDADVSELFRELDARNLSAFTSELTLAEVLVKPLADRDSDLVENYKKFVTNSKYLTVVPVARSIILRAAEVRSILGLRLPDAIHLATALESGCTSLVTNDREMKVTGNIALVLM